VANPGLNAIGMRYEGTTWVTFSTGQTIAMSYPMEQLNGMMYGPNLRNEAVGKVHFEDSLGMTCDILIGGTTEHPTDYLEGTIKGPRGDVLGNLSGTYLGYLDIDGERFWDMRQVPHLDFPRGLERFPNTLPSDSVMRGDLQNMFAEDWDKALREKQLIEERERTRRKMRKQGSKAKK